MPATTDPDARLFPADPAVRAAAVELYGAVRDAPIISPHGHVDPGLLLRDEPFGDPASLLITPDHYVTRLLHANGVQLSDLGVGAAEPLTEGQSRRAWRLLCEHWGDLAGTPVRYWLTAQLRDLFGLDAPPTAATADALYDQVAEHLASPGFRPRALLERFGIRVLATTDDPADDLAAHAALAAQDLPARVIPTFRPDRYTDPSAPGWARALEDLARASGVDCGRRAGLLEALRVRRRVFIEHGCTATDTGAPDAGSEPLAPPEAERIHAAGLAGTATAAEGRAYRRDVLYRLAEMSTEDGLVMQLHAGVLRDHHGPTRSRYGPDTGHDLPLRTDFTAPLRPLLNAFGTHPELHLVLFTVDETAFSRDVAPLAGFYPSVYAGAPWWFLDSPAAIARYRAAVTDSAGFTKTSGFIDDTRAFCSIPARHDMSRRADAVHLASLVTTGQLEMDEAHAVASRLVHDIPVATFRLEAHV